MLVNFKFNRIPSDNTISEIFRFSNINAIFSYAYELQLIFAQLIISDVTKIMESEHLHTPEYKISVILLQVLEKLKEEPIASKINAAKLKAGNDSIKVIQYVLPIVMQVEMDVLKFHGYDDSENGLTKFTQLVKELEEIDSAIRNLHEVLKSIYLPPVSVYYDDESSLNPLE